VKTRMVGRLEVSVVGLGGNSFGTDFFGKRCDRNDTAKVIHAALDAGINFIDTAEEYSIVTTVGDRRVRASGRSEEYIGLALASRRDEMVIATKYNNTSQEDPDQRGAQRIIRAVEGSLQRLGTDHIDLYQQHSPDAKTPIDEILEALDRLVVAGKVREVGCSNVSGAMIDEAEAASITHGIRSFASVQNRYNLLDPLEDGVRDACTRHGIKLLPHSPLAGGLLSGKYTQSEDMPPDSRFGSDAPLAKLIKNRELSQSRVEKVEKLHEFARNHDHSLLDLAFSWLASQPIVGSIIAGATKPEQIIANVAAASWELTDSDLRTITSIIS
jgi:aryl-alcohol dehydrogenase-like predicted oxidoreductase